MLLHPGKSWMIKSADECTVLSQPMSFCEVLLSKNCTNWDAFSCEGLTNRTISQQYWIAKGWKPHYILIIEDKQWFLLCKWMEIKWLKCHRAVLIFLFLKAKGERSEDNLYCARNWRLDEGVKEEKLPENKSYNNGEVKKTYTWTQTHNQNNLFQL